MKRIISIITALMIMILSLSACNKSQKEEQKTVLISVEAETVKNKDINEYINISSKIEAINEITVIPKISGTVKDVNVNLGDYVKKGDILFTIDDKDIRLQLEQAQASLNSAKANYNLSVEGNIQSQIEQLTSNVKSLEIQYEDVMSNLEKMQELYQAGAIAENELDKLKTNADTLSLQLETAKKTLEITKNDIYAGTKEVASSTVQNAQTGVNIIQNQLEHTILRAEMDGTISNINISKAQRVSPQNLAMTISDIDKTKLSFQVSENAIEKIKKGSKAYISIKALSDTPLQAQVSNISEVADSKSLLYPVEVIIDNKEQKIKPGMFATVKLILNSKQNTISLPLNAVLYKNKEYFVYVIDKDNIVHKKVVQTGISNDEEIEIVSGLSLGMRVVTKGQDFITDGLEVNVVGENQDK